MVRRSAALVDGSIVRCATDSGKGGAETRGCARM
jgi:hypothetical protein